MNKQIDMEAEMLKIIEDARETYANDVTDHTENEYIREGLLNANYRKTEDVAREIFEEIIDALGDERIKEDQKANSALEAQDTMSYEIFSYAEDKLGTLLTALEIYKNLYLKKYEREGADDE